MARAKSIGSLFVDIEARTAKLESDMERVKTTLRKGKAEIAAQGEEWGKLSKANEKSLNQLAGRVAGAISIFSLLKREISYVSTNIDRIPGIPAVTVASIKEMQASLASARNDVDRFIAGGISGFNMFAKALGASLGALDDNLYQQRNDDYMQDIEDGLKAVKDDLDEVAQAQDVTYNDRVLAAMARLAEQKKKLARSSMDEAHEIMALRREAELYRKFVETSGSNSNRLTKVEATITATERQAEADRKLQAMKEKLLEQEKRVTESLEGGAIATLTISQAVEAYTSKVWKLRIALQGIDAAMRNDPLNPVLLKDKIDKTKELADAQEKLNGALKKQGELGMKVGQSIADNLGDAIMRGEGLHEMMQQIFRDILRIVLQKSLIEPLGGMLGGVFGSIFKFGAGKANGGPIGPGMRVVGEHGPEVLATSGYGTIIPNSQLRGGGGGSTIYIDATGADAAALNRVLQEVRQLAGPGVTERRAVGAVVSGKWRRGAIGNSLSAS